MRVVIFTSLLAALISTGALSQAIPESKTLVGEITKIDRGTREAHMLTEAGEIEVDYTVVTRFGKENRGLTGRDSLEVGDAVRVIFVGAPDSVNSRVEFVEILGKNDPAYRDFVQKKGTIDRSERIRVSETRIRGTEARAESAAPSPRTDVVAQNRRNSEIGRQQNVARLPDTASLLPLFVATGLGSAAVAGTLRTLRRRRR